MLRTSAGATNVSRDARQGDPTPSAGPLGSISGPKKILPHTTREESERSRQPLARTVKEARTWGEYSTPPEGPGVCTYLEKTENVLQKMRFIRLVHLEILHTIR